MATLILVRHGRSTANAAGVLAGRTAGVALDEVGQEQAVKVAARLAPSGWVETLTSPLERCVETASAVVGALRPGEVPTVEEDLTECGYGEWEGRFLKDLVKEDLWKDVQRRPSTVVFPGGESMEGMQRRAVDAVRRHDARITQRWGAECAWVAVSHGDVIKSVVADALGLDLDRFQRLHVDPASVTVIRYAEDTATLLAMNTHAGDLAWLARPRPDGDAVVPGGGSGPAPGTTGA
ncbi:MAG: MSMEG_4193 family putative phosphomutase [Nocardioides sp.]|nr:MSMEG_4193 family putative phosphomutase [Nocardioides sp.]